MSLPLFEFVMVKSKVTVESQPTELVVTQVALLLLDVYVFPSTQV